MKIKTLLAAAALCSCVLAQAQFSFIDVKSDSGKSRSDKPTFINADAADIDIANNRATFMGNVKVDDPDMILTCRKLIIYLSDSKKKTPDGKPQSDDLEGGKRVSRIECQDDVVIVRKKKLSSGEDQKAYASQGIYDVEKGSIKLSGQPKPLIVSGASKIRGETITLYTDTERVEITYPDIEAVNLGRPENEKKPEAPKGVPANAGK